MSAFLEVSTQIPCIYNCRYCPQNLLKNNYKSENKNLLLDDFKIAVDKLPVSSTVSFAGFNEPLQNKECIDMILYANQKGHWIWMFTTLYNLSINDYEKIRNCNFGFFSLHLPDADGYTKMKITDQYKETLKYVVTNPPPHATFGYHHHHGLVHESIRDIVPDSQVLVAQDRAGEVKEEGIISHLYNSGKIKCGHTFLFNHKDGACVLLPDGTCVLCCNCFGLQHKLGNLKEQTWQEIMQGQEMQRVVKGLSDESIDILCRKCAIARSVD